jgi:hypothetical protein
MMFFWAQHAAERIAGLRNPSTETVSVKLGQTL